MTALGLTLLSKGLPESRCEHSSSFTVPLLAWVPEQTSLFLLLLFSLC